MPEIKELFNNEASYNFVDYTSEWLNCSVLKSIVITTFLDCNYTVSIEWSVDNNYSIIEIDTVNKLADEVHTFELDILARFCRLKITNISIPCLLQSQGFFYTKTKTGFSLENLGSGVEIYNNNLNGVKTLVAGLNITLVENNTEIEILNTAPQYEITNVIEQSGGNVILFSDGVGPELITRSLNNGVGIDLLQTPTAISFNNTLPSTLINISSIAGGLSLINSNVNPNFVIKTLVQGTDISLIDDGNTITINSTASIGNSPYTQNTNLIEPLSLSVNAILSGESNIINAGAVNSGILGSELCEISGGRSDGCMISSSISSDIKTTNSNGSGKRCSLVSCTNCTSNINAGTNISMISSIDAVTSGSSYSSLICTSSCILNAVNTCLISSSLNSAILGERTQECSILGSNNSVISTSSGNGLGNNCIILGSLDCGVGNILGVGSNAGDAVSILSSANSQITDRAINCSIVASSNTTMSGNCQNTVFIGDSISNTGNRSNSMVIGSNSILNNNNCFMWSDGSGGMGNSLQTSSNSQFLVKCSGGSGFYSNTNLTSGVFLGPGNASWSSICDINKKQNLVIVDNVDILNKIKQLPIYSYNYVGNVQQQKHISTTAQAWYELFPCECIIKDVLDEEGNQTLDELGNIIREEVHTKDQFSIENLDITGSLLSCVQELNSQIELLKVRISTLENP